jgi:hypothetical protein
VRLVVLYLVVLALLASYALFLVGLPRLNDNIDNLFAVMGW